MRAEFLLQRELNDSLSCGRVISSNFRPHFHSHIEIYLVISGEIEVFINDQRRILREGEMSVAFSYDVHAYNTPKNSSAYYLIIPTKFFGDFLSFFSNKHPSVHFIDDKITCDTVKNAIEKILEKPNELSRQGYLYIILGAILDLIPDSDKSDDTDLGLSPDILIYLSKHFREELTLSSLAAEFGYNPSYMSRSFKNTFGISFGKYLTMLRLRESVLLMNKGGMSITECAFESGFGSMRSFYRAFNDEFGCSPKEHLKTKIL